MSFCNIFQIGRSQESASIVNSAKFDVGEVRIRCENILFIISQTLPCHQRRVLELAKPQVGGGGNGEVVEVAFTAILTEATAGRDETASGSFF